MGIDWNGLKKEYESGQARLKALAEKYGCHADSIRRKAKKESWEQKGRERQVSGLKTKDLKKGLEELKVAKMAGEVISGMIRSKRLELGFEEAGAQKEADEPEEIAGEMARVTASSGAEEAVD